MDKVQEDAPYKVDRKSDLFEEMMRRKDETLIPVIDRPKARL